MLGGISFLLSSRSVGGLMDPDVYNEVLQYFTLRLRVPVRSHIAAVTDGVPVLPHVIFFDYIVINQRRYWASTRTNNDGSSLIAVATGPRQVHVGELTHIFTLQQSTLGGLYRFGRVRWLRPANIDLSQTTWRHW